MENIFPEVLCTFLYSSISFYIQFLLEPVKKTLGKLDVRKVKRKDYRSLPKHLILEMLLERGMTKSRMRIEAGLTTNVLANMNKGQHISMESLIRICDALDCELNNVVELVKTEEQ